MTTLKNITKSQHTGVSTLASRTTCPASAGSQRADTFGVNQCLVLRMNIHGTNHYLSQPLKR